MRLRCATEDVAKIGKETKNTEEEEMPAKIICILMDNYDPPLCRQRFSKSSSIE